MLDVEPLILDELGRAAPLGGFEAASWEDVLQRAGIIGARDDARRRRRRLAASLVVAALLVVAVAVSPIGAAIGHSFADFSDWLSGSPGKPASVAAQRTFTRGNAHDWAGFPAGTKLRRLIATRRDGVTFTLYGFRSGDSLCLSLVAEGAARGSTLGCAPLRDLRARPQPALVLNVDYPIGTIPGKRVRVGPDVYTVARDSVSFGIVSDGVRRVTLRSDDKTRRATIASDAFISIAARPPVGNRVRSITATTKAGTPVAIPFTQSPFGDTVAGSAAVGAFHGPAHVDRVVHGGTVRWFEQWQLRGRPLPPKLSLFGGGTVVFGRMIAPDPGSRIRMGLLLERIGPGKGIGLEPGLYTCTVELISRTLGSGCGKGVQDWFAHQPFDGGSETFGGGSQYSILSGVASDTVARIRLFLSTGEVVDVPLKDNLYLVEAAGAKFPLRLVFYDDHGRVIGIQSLGSALGGPSGPAYEPAKNGHWRVVSRVTRADGRTVALWAVRSQAGGWCWKAVEPGGGEESGCVPPKLKTPIRLEITPTARAGARATLLAQVRSDVARVEVRYRSGATEQIAQRDGFVLYAPSRARVGAHDVITSITALDRSGKKLGEVGLPPKG